jgi:hypothetical protein
MMCLLERDTRLAVDAAKPHELPHRLLQFLSFLKKENAPMKKVPAQRKSPGDEGTRASHLRLPPRLVLSPGPAESAFAGFLRFVERERSLHVRRT